MQCPGCQKSIADDSKFCQHCGVQITLGGPGPARADAPAQPLVGGLAGGLPGGRLAADPANEKPVLDFRPAWRSHVGSWAGLALFALVLIFLAYKMDADAVWWRTIVFVVLGLAAIVGGRQAWCVLSIRYRLTTQRLFIERGLVNRTTDQTELVRVDDVRIKQGLVARVLNIGDVEIISSDKTDQDFVLRGCEEPLRIAEEIRRNTRLMRSRQTMYVENV